MKTLIINGSPRKDGDTAALIRAYKDGLLGEAAELSAFDLKIAPCTDCRACRTLHRCVQRDAMEEVEAALAECDRVLIASPVWMGSLPAPLLALGSRLQWRWYARESLPPKKGAILLAAGGSGDVSGARRSAELMLRLMGVKGRIPFAGSLATDTLPAAEDETALTAAKAIAKDP
ncbi:MAG: flavodoxin family protein [Clostridia bacterium]|nr:flavodoxin family protein [Clostridia bacterium]